MRLSTMPATWVIITLLTVAFVPPVQAEIPITDDVVLDWNHVLLELNRNDHGLSNPDQGGPAKTSRAFAMAHIAIYDAFNSVEPVGQPYLASVPLARTASKEAAVSVAAYVVLKSLYPSQAALLDQAQADYLASIPDSRAKSLGIAVGRIVGNLTLASRILDGTKFAAKVTYHPNNLPGTHRVDPINPNQGYYAPGWGLVSTFASGDVDQFDIPAPPHLTSQEYADAFNEVKDIGSKNSSSRTADQTEIGIFWGYDGRPGLGTPPRLYNQAVRTIAELQANSPGQNARLFALINIAMADAGIAAWDDKYTHDFWRPVIAIREADPGTGPTGLGDGNPNTEADLNWEPLGAPLSNAIGPNFTPPFPAYASGHATFGSATFTILKLFYGTDSLNYTLTSDEYNGITTDNQGNVRPVRTRNYSSFSQAIQENADSRIYLGVHWRFDATAGVTQGTAIANTVFNSILRPTNAKSSQRVAGKKPVR